jgi:dipeptidyl aminopeptidase/acylaminoacyl peptidase
MEALVKSDRSEYAPLYSPDGRSIAFLASDDPPVWAFTSDIYIVKTEGGEPRRLSETFDRRADLISWSADGRKIYYTETRGTITGIYAMPVDDGKPETIDDGARVITGVSLNRERGVFGFVSQTTDKPPEAFTSAADKFRPLEVSRANADLPDYPLGRTEVIRWKSSDGLEIEGLLTHPVGYRSGKTYPFLLIIHGGPMGVYRQSYIADPSAYPIAAFAGEGYLMLRCNIRGSSGYGKEFRYANIKDWGGGDYRDLMAGVDHVIGMGLADPDRLGVMGWSYGGFMTSWVITQTNRFKAASIGAPVTNLMSFTGTSDIPGFLPSYFGAEFWEDLDIYRDHSPMFQIAGASTPSLIQHGERDVRVPIGQGYELYNALKRRGVEVKMVVYPRASHGLGEPKQMLDAMEQNLEWFAKFLKPQGE